MLRPLHFLPRVSIKPSINSLQTARLLLSKAATGTHKGSKIKDASSPPARKHKSLIASKEPASIAQTLKSQHFPPPPPPPPPARLTREVKTIKQREAWEEQLLLDGRKAGRMIANIARDLPGRSRGACCNRFHEVFKFQSQIFDFSNSRGCSLPLSRDHNIG